MSVTDELEMLRKDPESYWIIYEEHEGDMSDVDYARWLDDGGAMR